MSALLTDLYELNMAASYLRRGMSGPATFSLFVRRLPPERGFLVAAGIEPALDRLEGFRFEAEELRYLQEELRFPAGDLEAFRRLRFTGDVWAVPEGTIVLAGEPLVEVTGPVAEAQLVETILLNELTFATTVASKAARCVIAARGRELIDFGFRRTQGLDAGLEAARVSALVGFAATSNVEAARRHGLVAAGTMAHSYIESFEDETAAFRAFAEDFPDRPTFLVDTYDTLAGVRRAIAVMRELPAGARLGVRLDSGDLDALARGARDLLDAAGLPQARIVASGGLDELEIDDLLRAGAPIDAFGVGTKMGVSADRPYLDTAYKLVQYGERPVMKLSSGKMTAPGRKQVQRTADPFADLVALRDEPVPPGAAGLLELRMAGGRRLGPGPSLADGGRRFEAGLRALPANARSLREPVAPMATLSSRLERLAAETRARAEAAAYAV